MDVIFQPSQGSPFYMEVGYFDTVLEIKEKIQKEKGIPVSKQTLSFNGNILRDDLNVHNSDIIDRSRIHLLLPSDPNNISNNHHHPTKIIKDEDQFSPSKINLLIKMPSSKVGSALQVVSNETVQRLKERIQEKEGVQAGRLAVYVNGMELQDHKSMQEYKLCDNAEISVSVRSSPSATRSSLGNTNGSMNKLKIFVLNKCGAEKIPMEVSFLDNVGELRKKMHKMKLDLPQEGYFFIYKQTVMDDDRSFRWHHVGQGDVIEIFSGSVSGGS